MDNEKNLDTGRQVELSQLLAAGVAAYGAGQLEEAEAASEELIRAFPNCAEGYELKGVLRFKSKQHDEALQYLRHSLALNPGSADAWNNLGVVLMGLGKWVEAGDAFLKTLERNPEHISAARHLGFILEKLERPGDAATHYLSLMQRFGPRTDVLEDYIRVMVAQGLADAIQPSLPEGFNPPAVALLTARSFLEREDWESAERYSLASLDLAGGKWPTPDVHLEYFRAMYYMLIDALLQKGYGKGGETCFRERYLDGVRAAFHASGAQLPRPVPSTAQRLAVVVPGFINEHFGPTVLVMGLLIRFMENLGWEAVLINCDYSFYNQALAGIHDIVKLPAGRSHYIFAGRELTVFTPAAAAFRERFEEVGRFLTDFAPSVIFTAGTELNPYSDLLAASWPTLVVPMNWRPPFCYGHLYHVPSEDPTIVGAFRRVLPPQADLLPYERLFPFVLPNPATLRERAEFGLDGGDFVYLLSGLLMEAAYTPEYQLILAEILEQVEHARFLIIGSTEDAFPWSEPRLERWRGSRLVFSAYQPDLRSVLRLGDVFLHPPAPRNGGTVRLCLAEGLPVLVEKRSGLKLVVPDEDMLDGLEAYRDAAVRLARDPAFRDRAAARSRELDARFEAEAAEYMQTLEEAAFRTVEIFQRIRGTHFLYSDKGVFSGG